MEEILKYYQQSAELSIPLTLLNLSLCIAMSLIIRYVYVQYSSTRSSKVALARVIPVISCATFMIIVIVKSSLALSLGLVGALSIVRFRTPIKEPEELTFLFLSIASGLGYAASQAQITTVIMLVTLVFVAISFGKSKHELNMGSINCYLEISNPDIVTEIIEKAHNIFGTHVFIIRKAIDSNGGKIVLNIASEDAAIKIFEEEIQKYGEVIKYEMIASIQTSA